MADDAQTTRAETEREWYYVEDGKQVGPLGEERLHALVRQGVIQAGTLVWCEGMAEWAPYARVQSQQSSDAQAVQAGDGAADWGAARPAGFWIRVGAKVLDGLVVAVITGLLTGASALVSAGLATLAPDSSVVVAMAVAVGNVILQLAVGAAYATFFIGRFGATPGKMACGLKVVRPGGGPVGYLRAFGRHFAEFISAMILLIGYIMVAFDSEKRALHDHICDTRVIHSR